MYVLTSEIKIAKYVFKHPAKVLINTSTRSLANTAEVDLPLSVVLENKQRTTVDKLINRGDPVTIKLGYDNDLYTEFTGFVMTKTVKEHTITIGFEDNLHKLRKPLDNKGLKNTTLKDILKYVTDGIALRGDIPVVNFDSFAIKNATGIKVLRKLKDEYGFLAFLDHDNQLYVGLPYTYKTGNTHVYKLGYNEDNSQLDFKTYEDLKYKIKAISILKDNTKLEVETGDPDGELRTVYFRNISSRSKLKEMAEAELERYKYDGYQGTLKGFGLPRTVYGDSVKIKDENYPARDGTYYAEGVKITFGQNGFRREVELGIKL